MYEVEFQEDQLKSFHLITSKDETLCRKKETNSTQGMQIKNKLFVGRKEGTVCFLQVAHPFPKL